VPVLGYETCSRVAKQALAQKRRVADIVLEEKLLTKEQMDRLFLPEAMTSPARAR
jgi:aspartate ammonia-lyase